MSQTMLLTLLMATPLVISLLAFACRLAGGGAKGVSLWYIPSVSP
ncbi:Uncharacterised protein [Morganella morganii]|nr:Uncharacterised protein [Morganella morganii]